MVSVKMKNKQGGRARQDFVNTVGVSNIQGGKPDGMDCDDV